MDPQTPTIKDQALFDEKTMKDLERSREDIKQNLRDKFIVPPFSILDTKAGYWQTRKRQWISLGIQSELGRGGAKVAYNDHKWLEDQGQPYTQGIQTKVKSNPPNKDGMMVIDSYRSEDNPHSKRKRRLLFPESADTDFYKKKREYEKAIGHEMTTEDFQALYESEAAVNQGISIFDPVLTELCYRWFCPPGGLIYDPFAGGSVRGVVAKVLGFDYVGVDLREDQIVANDQQARELFNIKTETPLNGQVPHWICGNSLNIEDLRPDLQADLIFSCPPYYDLEVYSDNPEDISNLPWEEFYSQYNRIIELAVDRLKENRFAIFIIGDVRDKKGFYRNLIGVTKEAFDLSGAILYNEAILLNVIGSMPIRVSKQFIAGRKLGKVHQNVLIFFKGDPQTIRNEFPAEVSYGG